MGGLASSTPTFLLAQNFRTLALDMWGDIIHYELTLTLFSNQSCFMCHVVLYNRVDQTSLVLVLTFKEAFTKACIYSTGHKTSAYKVKYVYEEKQSGAILVISYKLFSLNDFVIIFSIACEMLFSNDIGGFLFIFQNGFCPR